jgi:hypothetical protein
MPPLGDSDFCWAHDPEQARERAEARRKGGKGRKTPGGGRTDVPPQSLRSVEEIQLLLEETVRETLMQENSAARSRAVAVLVGHALKCLEVGEHEERLAALEAALKRRSA